MALAWKAGWVHALTSSNLVSSATGIIALARADTPQLHLCAPPRPISCPESAPKVWRLPERQPTCGSDLVSDARPWDAQVTGSSWKLRTPSQPRQKAFIAAFCLEIGSAGGGVGGAPRCAGGGVVTIPPCLAWLDPQLPSVGGRSGTASASRLRRVCAVPRAGWGRAGAGVAQFPIPLNGHPVVAEGGSSTPCPGSGAMSGSARLSPSMFVGLVGLWWHRVVAEQRLAAGRRPMPSVRWCWVRLCRSHRCGAGTSRGCGVGCGMTRRASSAGGTRWCRTTWWLRSPRVRSPASRPARSSRLPSGPARWCARLRPGPTEAVSI